jgi:hypothetical protein
VAKLTKGERVCALLVCNKWGIDFTCFVGVLQKVEKRGLNGEMPVATIEVDKAFYLYGPVQEQKAHPYHLDARLWKILPWNKETRAEVKSLRKACRTLDEMTRKVKAL